MEVFEVRQKVPLSVELFNMAAIVGMRTPDVLGRVTLEAVEVRKASDLMAEASRIIQNQMARLERFEPASEKIAARVEELERQIGKIIDSLERAMLMVKRNINQEAVGTEDV